MRIYTGILKVTTSARIDLVYNRNIHAIENTLSLSVERSLFENVEFPS